MQMHPVSESDQTIRDMMGLLSLPALWAGRDGETLLDIVTEAVERIVPIAFSYVTVPVLPGEPAVKRVRVNGAKANGAQAREWSDAAEEWIDRHQIDARAFIADTPSGEMRVIRFRLGLGKNSGFIYFGSFAGDFPHITQLAYLRAAASLAMTGLQTVYATYEREQASRAKDEFLAMLGHELRNPLAPIVTALKVIELKHGPLQDELALVNRQVGHLQRLVDDLLDVSRITRGKVELKKDVLDLRQVIASAIEAVSGLIEQHKHCFSAYLPDDAVWVYGDRTRLIQVFTNLLINAVKYTEPGGVIALAVNVTDTSTAVSIQDNGAGISPELFPRLFTIFEQGSSTIDRAEGGLGIGLAIVKTIVELHGGRVCAYSDGIGMGSEFVVTLPLTNSLQMCELNNLDVSANHSGKRVLIVDDNIDALNTLKTYLELMGFKVHAESDPVTALQIAKIFNPSVAVLDIGLPIMDGHQLAQELRNIFPSDSLHLIALTGYGQPHDRERSINAGFNTHLVKPVDLTALLEILDR